MSHKLASAALKLHEENGEVRYTSRFINLVMVAIVGLVAMMILAAQPALAQDAPADDTTVTDTTDDTTDTTDDTTEDTAGGTEGDGDTAGETDAPRRCGHARGHSK